jgi:hypothetical protein
MVAPNRNKVSASKARWAQSPGREHGTTARPDHMMTRRQPKRAASTPVTGIASSEPMPRHSSSKPSCAASTPVRDCAYGTNGAHEDMAMPAARKASRVETRCFKP